MTNAIWWRFGQFACAWNFGDLAMRRYLGLDETVRITRSSWQTPTMATVTLVALAVAFGLYSWALTQETAKTEVE